jgi:hypothetical protein
MSETTHVETVEQQTNKKRKLPFGHYKVQIRKENMDADKLQTSNKEVCKPPTQEELADSWRPNLPRNARNQPIHHWSVTLAQLPPYLWCKNKKTVQDGKEVYPIIKDGIYYYSVNPTKYDSELKSLYQELMKGYKADKDEIKILLEKLDNQVNGWLIIRAKRFMKDIHNRYFLDLQL